MLDARHGVAQAGVKVDVYAFGLLLWAMVAGEEPWSGARGWTRFGVIRAVMDGERPPMVAPAPPSPAPVSAPVSAPASGCGQLFACELMRMLIQKCWAQKPAARPTASEVVLALSGILEQTEHKAL